MTNSLIYVRVSSKPQVSGLSLDDQERMCELYNQSKGYHSLPVFIGAGEPAGSTKRKAFQDMLAYCRRNRKNVNVVVFCDLDRFSRKTQDSLVVQSELFDIGILLECVNQPIEDTPDGRFNTTVAVAAGQRKREERSAEQAKNAGAV